MLLYHKTGEMEVRCLGADEAWDLFCEKIGEVTLESHRDIPELARMVVERCRGSPLAVSAIGVTMAGKNSVQEWRDAIDALAKFSGMEDENEILAVLKFSYDNLKNERLKQCFQYCALFREDEVIFKDDLVEYWIDEGIVDGKEDRYRAEEECYEIISYLVHACLLVKSKFGLTVSVPSLVRETALWVASNLGEEKENFFVKPNAKLGDIPNVKDWERVIRMSLSNNRIKKIRCSPDCPKLKTLFLQLNDLEKISSGFFKLMPSLVVLDLSTNVSLRELPEEISRLVSLQYLNLSHTKIEELPLGLKELRKLLHLNLEFAGMLKSISGVSSLSNLQVLKLYCSLELDMELVEELKLLKHLKVLTVSGGDANAWEHFMSIPRLASCTRNVVLTHCEARAAGISIGPTSSRLQGLTIYESNIREFKIDQKGDDDDDDESKKISPKALSNTTCNFRYLVNVEISECKGLRDLTWLIFAPNLVTLEVKDSPHIEEIVSKNKAGSFFMNGEEEAYEISVPFMKLKHLELENLEDLDSIYWSPLSFPCLVKIDVFGCPNLRKLPLSSSSASGCELIIYGEEDWLEELQWEEEDTKDNFTLKIIKVDVVTGSSSFNPQSQSELELRKRVADLEEENRSIKQRLERIEMMFWQQQQPFMYVPRMQQFQQPNLIQKDVQQQGLQASGQAVGSLLPPQNVIHQSQRTLPQMPSTPLDSRGNANGGDWQEMVFQKIKSMKEMYLADLTEIHRKVTAKLQLDSLPDQQRSEQIERLKQFKEMVERMMRILSVSKNDIMPELKDKVDYYEKQIIGFLNMHMPRKAQEQKQLP